MKCEYNEKIECKLKEHSKERCFVCLTNGYVGFLNNLTQLLGGVPIPMNQASFTYAMAQHLGKTQSALGH